MRAPRTIVLIGLIAASAGCNILQGYYYKPEFFRFATVREAELSVPLHRGVENVKQVLRNNDMTIKDVEPGAEQAQIWASKDGLQYVFDLKASGEEGCTVHMEIDQAGNDGLAWRLLGEIQLQP